MNFVYRGFQKLEHDRQTDKHTDSRTDATECTATQHSRVAKIQQLISLFVFTE